MMKTLPPFYEEILSEFAALYIDYQHKDFLPLSQKRGKAFPQ